MRSVVLLVAAAGALVLGVAVLSSKRGAQSNAAPPANRDAQLRAAAVGAALAEFARINAPGAPPVNPNDYWQVAGEKPLTAAEVRALDWCGGFYLWALKVAGIAPPSVTWHFDGSGLASAKLRPTNDPQPADLAYFTKNQHHAMVESVDGDTIHLINGNGGGKGITRSSVQRNQVAGFFSIDPLLHGGLVA